MIARRSPRKIVNKIFARQRNTSLHFKNSPKKTKNKHNKQHADETQNQTYYNTRQSQIIVNLGSQHESEQS